MTIGPHTREALRSLASKVDWWPEDLFHDDEDRVLAGLINLLGTEFDRLKDLIEGLEERLDNLE